MEVFRSVEIAWLSGWLPPGLKIFMKWLMALSTILRQNIYCLCFCEPQTGQQQVIFPKLTSLYNTMVTLMGNGTCAHTVVSSSLMNGSTAIFLFTRNHWTPSWQSYPTGHGWVSSSTALISNTVTVTAWHWSKWRTYLIFLSLSSPIASNKVDRPNLQCNVAI